MKKGIKIIVYTILVLIVLLSIGIPSYTYYWRTSNTLTTFTSFEESKDIEYSDIIWVNDTIGGEVVEKTAFYVPVKIKGIKEQVYMQFDTGNPATVLYDKPLEQLLHKYPTLKTVISKDSISFLSNTHITIGNLKLHADKIKVLKNMGTSQPDSSFIKIGSLGFDTFAGKTLILDFKKNKLAITTKSISELNETSHIVENASVDKFPLLLPIQIGNSNSRVFYDTGSSMFSLLTSEKKLAALQSQFDTDTLCCVSSWGIDYKILRKKISQPIIIGTITQNEHYVYGFFKLKPVDYLPNWFLFGITGNRIFENQKIVIDTKNNQFGIIK